MQLSVKRLTLGVRNRIIATARGAHGSYGDTPSAQGAHVTTTTESRWEDLSVRFNATTVTGRWTTDNGLVTVRHAFASTSADSSGPLADELMASGMLLGLLEAEQKRIKPRQRASLKPAH